MVRNMDVKQKDNGFPDAAETVKANPNLVGHALSLNASPSIYIDNAGKLERVIKIYCHRDIEKVLVRALKEKLGIEVEVRRYDG